MHGHRNLKNETDLYSQNFGRLYVERLFILEGYIFLPKFIEISQKLARVLT